MADVNLVMRKHGGFTLLETLVALAVLAISLGVIYQIFGTSLRNMQYAKEYSYAQMLAESKLSELGKGIPVFEGSFEGRFDEKYFWQMQVSQLPSTRKDGADEIKKYRIDFKILWESNKVQRFIDIPTYRLSSEAA